MTLKEEAYALIEKLPDKVMGDVLKGIKKTADDPKTWETPEQEQARLAREREESMQAFRELQEMIRTRPLRIPENYEEVYADAMAEKYGLVK
ncbi:MAG: hypothetical protein IJG34_06140 [Synergistaceae bacterium]|nr:hypothetical protein [Synergistaceae bacterium]MBQ3449457.1 hypothetical protein [Synergistaceae bacterium]MBQ3695090.1 hypothetical protein [Synergistaceae bacterium]MBQ9628691.1 hypothetical protein [Synergistaceae bacterium]MBR0069831.1 hypothetical protein [Synergistaceae bacterium]